MKTILIIDDTEANVNILMELLDEKYDILASLDGEGGLEIVEEERVDLILLDIVMPGIDGFEVCKRLKDNPNTKDIPIIFITANADEDSIERAYDAGGIDYITKPFKVREVLSRINTHLSLAQQKLYLEENLKSNINLLNQYKDVVDKSSIVSKTNLKGQITYVNDGFCEISGYSREELLEKNYNIVKYDDIWTKIQNKETWQGEVENIKKNGECYIVKNIVMPILDSNGKIEEYISVQHDITDIYELKQEIEDTQKEVIFTMGSIGETRSKETGNHVKRVAEYSKILAKKAGLSDKDVTLLTDASPMHDIGKVAINDNILHKPAKLTEDEFAIMRTHAELGHKMLAHSDRPLLKTAAKIALQHHERWDGKGYPKHLKGEDISIEGRITAIADVFDALGSSRVYKEAWDDDKIFEYFKEQRAKQFDPNLIDIFFENLDEFLEIREQFKDV
ncbi:MAG: response regulator [Campylobacterota bacterium]|nr:response regulator [Campylobacterota bacterium]